MNHPNNVKLLVVLESALYDPSQQPSLPEFSHVLLSLDFPTAISRVCQYFKCSKKANL